MGPLDRSRLEITSRAVAIGISVTMLVLLALVLTPHAAVAQTNTYVISSGSMEPALQQYDIVVVDFDVSFEDIVVGDIILFQKPEAQDRTIIHRVVSITQDVSGKRILRTKGDANPSSIPGTDYPITEELYIGKAVNVIPKAGLITQFIAPPVNYLIIAAIWGVIVPALYKRWKSEKPVVSVKDTAMPPPEIHGAVDKIAGKYKMAIKQVMSNQHIPAEGGRDFKWSWLIAGIIFAWPAAIAYYLTSKRNSMSVTVSHELDNKASSVSIQAIGRKGRAAANELISILD